MGKGSSQGAPLKMVSWVGAEFLDGGAKGKSRESSDFRLSSCFPQLPDWNSTGSFLEALDVTGLRNSPPGMSGQGAKRVIVVIVHPRRLPGRERP